MSIRAMNLEGGSSANPAPNQNPKSSSHQQDPLLGIPVIGSIVKNATDQFVHSSTVQSIVKDTTSKEVNPNYGADYNHQIDLGNQQNATADKNASQNENQHSVSGDMNAIGDRINGKWDQFTSHFNAVGQMKTDAWNQGTSYLNAGSTLVSDTSGVLTAVATDDVSAATNAVEANLKKSGAAQAYTDGQNNAKAIETNFDNTVQADLRSISFSGPASAVQQTLKNASTEATNDQNSWNAQGKKLEQQGGGANDIKAIGDYWAGGINAAWDNVVNGYGGSALNHVGDAGNALAHGYVSANAAQNDIENTAVSTAGSLITNAWNADTSVVSDVLGSL